MRSGLSVSWWWTFCAYLCTKFFYVCPTAEIWVPQMIRLPAFEAHLPGMFPRCVCGGMSVAAFGKNCSGEIKKKCSREADISLVASSISITKFWQMIELGTIHDWSWR